MTVEERIEAEDEALRLWIRATGERTPLSDGASGEGDGGERAIRLPAPSRLVLEGRRVRARRRLVAGSFAVAASLLVAVAGVGVATDAWDLPVPSLRGQREVEPATPTPVAWPKVRDVVNAMDTGFSSYSSYVTESYYYRSGSAETPQYAETEELPPVDRKALRASGIDRMVTLDQPSGVGESVAVTWAATTRGTTDVVRSESLGVLDLGLDGRGSWLQVRPTAADGWLVVAMLPQGASDVQLRVAGSTSLVPLNDLQSGLASVCFDAEHTDDGGTSCTGGPPGPMPRVRFATVDPRPQIDAVTYLDEDGTYVVLGPEAQVG